jgi:tetraacyldisaccharide 4'-kinase
LRAERLKEIWQGEGTDAAARLLGAGLRLLSIPYRGVVLARNRLHDRGLIRQQKLPRPVVSVGNLTVGGTGKTPTVILLANLLRQQGLRPAVLSRGYGGRARGPVNVVSNGEETLLNWREAGDEPVLIARASPGVPVLTGPRRSLTGGAAIERFGADCLILDDAFQHRALARDLDIVLVDRTRPFGNGRLLPAGPLREPQAALGRAHLLIVTGQGPDGPPSGLPDGLPSFRGLHRRIGFVEAGTGRLLGPGALKGVRVCAFAGIGRPESFRQSLAAAGAEVVSFRAFPDHHPYRRSELEEILATAATSGAAQIVTTEKDGIRLGDFPDLSGRLLLLRIDMEILPAGPFTALLFDKVLY